MATGAVRSDGGRTLYACQPPATGSDSIDEQEVISFAIRWVCHLLVDRVPERGLAELAESLLELKRYYTHYEPPPAIAPRTVKVATSAVNRSVRPSFTLEEE